MVSLEDTTIVKELLLADVPFERISEIFRDRIDEKNLAKIVREVFSEKTKEEDHGKASVLGGLGRTIVNRCVSALNDETFMDSYFSILKEQVPEDFMDPIFMTMMQDPVVISSGFVFDRHSVIDEKTKKLRFSSCPFTREKLKEDVYPLLSFKKKLFTFKMEKIEQLLELCENFIMDRLMNAQMLAKTFIDNLGDSTYVHLEKKVVELNFKAWEKAESSLKQELWDSDALVDNLIRFRKCTFDLGVGNKEEFHTRISELERYVYDTMSNDQLEVAESWLDAIKKFDGLSKAKLSLPVSKVRLEIAKKLNRDADLFDLRLSYYTSIKSDSAAVEEFFQDEGLSEDEINYLKYGSSQPIGVAITYGSHIETVTFAYHNKSKIQYGNKHGNIGATFKLEIGEKVVTVEGFQPTNEKALGTYIKLTTNLNKEFLVRGTKDPDPHSFPDLSSFKQKNKKLKVIQNGYYYLKNDDGIFRDPNECDDDFLGIFNANEQNSNNIRCKMTGNLCPNQTTREAIFESLFGHLERITFIAANDYGLSARTWEGSPMRLGDQLIIEWERDQLTNQIQHNDKFRIKSYGDGSVAFESLTVPGLFIGLGESTSEFTFTDQSPYKAVLVDDKDSLHKLRIVPPRNGDVNFVSIEPVSKPGYSINHCNGKLLFSIGMNWNNEYVFKQDSSWRFQCDGPEYQSDEEEESDQSDEEEESDQSDDEESDSSYGGG
eukprot:CAMPEP_0178977750 /NCGR_PEP_ID=MMETSP0789-20121207/24703_1 /TAXON_ID=3005 /ORGANISM="Rhizosolenia setigera, Strain CCMP 1694" /LENGTH=715 /DNA_ID=CAMNT_0020667265 /DNA_START=52 /DNA_END=2199 /DNA_ORIENTATION=-